MRLQETPDGIGIALRSVLRASVARHAELVAQGVSGLEEEISATLIPSSIGATPEISPAEVDRLADALLPLLRRQVRHARDLVAPPGDMVAQACRVLARTDLRAPDSPVVTATLRIVHVAVLRRTALRADPRHLTFLTSLTDAAARLLLHLAERYPTPLLTRLDVRCETLRHRAPSPRHIRLVEDESIVLSPDEPLVTRSVIAELERLMLVHWSDGVITPRENPGFANARRRARLGTPTLSEGLRRWFAGQHMAPVVDDEGGPARPSGVGGIELRYRILQLTPGARSLAMSVRLPRSAHRWRQNRDDGRNGQREPADRRLRDRQ